MLTSPVQPFLIVVALLAEGVDRNNYEVYGTPNKRVSPSSRRAWIEIAKMSSSRNTASMVALLTEGVDRNLADLDIRSRLDSRPPHGGRG